MSRALSRLRLVGLLLTFFGCQLGYSKDMVHKPQGVYKTIDVRLATDTIKALQGGRSKKGAEQITKVLAAPENYSPPVLFLVSSILFEDGRRDEAMFWFYAGQLRGRIDANICADRSAAAAVDALNDKFGTPINKYAFGDLQKLQRTVTRVVEWEEKTGCHYDRRWINLHGLQAFKLEPSVPLSQPQQEWEAIRAKTRTDYRAGFDAAVKTLQKDP